MTLSVNFSVNFLILIITLFLYTSEACYAQVSKDTLILKDQVNRLQEDIEEQKTITSTLLKRINDLIEKQNDLIKQYSQTNIVIQGLQSTQKTKPERFKNAFVLNKDGKPYAYIGNDLKLYEYYGKDLIGWIKSETNEIVRNFDEAVVAIIDGDFILDETGHAIGSIEQSENLRWDREKLYSQVQKRPISHYFVRLENPKQFTPSTFRFSDWSTQKIEDVLFFSEKKIQKLR